MLQLSFERGSSRGSRDPSVLAPCSAWMTLKNTWMKSPHPYYALAGDINALKICLDRLVPKVKDNAEPNKEESMQRTLERLNEVHRQYAEY